MIDYEKEVKKVYPDSVKQKHGVLYYIQNGKDGNALGVSYQFFELAWENAYQTLVKQGKLKSTMESVSEQD